MIRNKENNGTIQGLKVARGSPTITHLFFVDDSLLFAIASPQLASVLKGILSFYESASGRMINFQKSVLSFSPNVTVSTIGSIKNIFGIDVVFKHSRCLGLPTSITYNHIDIFKPIVKSGPKGWRVERKIILRGWEKSPYQDGRSSDPYLHHKAFRLSEGAITGIHRRVIEILRTRNISANRRGCLFLNVKGVLVLGFHCF